MLEGKRDFADTCIKLAKEIDNTVELMKQLRPKKIKPILTPKQYGIKLSS